MHLHQAAAALVIRLGWAELPMHVTWRIGFTMSLFIAGLAYGNSQAHSEAVLGVLLASLLSAIVGLLWLRAVLPGRGAA